MSGSAQMSEEEEGEEEEGKEEVKVGPNSNKSRIPRVDAPPSGGRMICQYQTIIDRDDEAKEPE